MNIIERIKNHARQLIGWLTRNNGLVLVVWIILGAIIWLTRKIGLLNDEWLDVSIFAAMILTLLCDHIVSTVQKWLFNKYEDRNKLTVDYNALVKMYPLSKKQMVKYNNSNIDPENLKCVLNKEKVKNQQNVTNYPVIFPVVLESETYGVPFEFHDFENKHYEAPAIAKEHFDELMEAHGSSNVYNQLNIRVDDWGKKRGKFHVYTSRTTYFDSLTTNRSIDYKLKNGQNLRNFFGVGPILPSLKDSKLSNHLGFNGFVETADGYIPLFLRGKNMSIGKNTYGDSIGSSLKYRYIFENNKKLTLKGIENALLATTEDETRVPRDQIEWHGISKHVITAYRDIVEGGKPQFLLYAKTKLTKAEVAAKFKKQTILWLHRDDLDKIAITPSYIVHNRKIYPMVPSASASIVMLKDFLRKQK